MQTLKLDKKSPAATGLIQPHRGNYIMTGWIKLHRSVSDNWVWNCEFSYGQAWIDLLCHACHKPNKLTIKGQLILLGIGDQARSEVTLSKVWKWSRNKVRRFLSNLEKDGMIERKTTHLTSIISICNYSNFQHCDTADGTAKGQLKDSRRNTNKNVKNVENVKNTFNAKRIIPIWNSLGCKQHKGLTQSASNSLAKTYAHYCKESESPKELNDWLEAYLKNGFKRYMTDHHRQLDDGQWSADLEFAVRFSTYDKIRNTKL